MSQQQQYDHQLFQEQNMIEIVRHDLQIKDLIQIHFLLVIFFDYLSQLIRAEHTSLLNWLMYIPVQCHQGDGLIFLQKNIPFWQNFQGFFILFF
ncbi:hypothetical protein pb186bvf_014711 [Paramecium bursaria]